MRNPVLVLLLLTAALAVAATGDTGQTIRAVDLKAQPSADASNVAALAVNTRVEVLKRQGAWLQVKASGGEGWLRMLSVRGDGAPGKGSGGGGLKALGSLVTTGSSGTAPVATGVRGLSEEDLSNAQENPAELARMQGNASSAADARSFASQAKLKAQTVAYLPAAAGSGKGEGK